MEDRIRLALAAARETEALDRDALAAQRRADVVTWRRPAGRSDPHRPEPWFSERGGHEPRWLDDAPDPHTEDVVGFDADGRVVLRELRWSGSGDARLEEVWRHGDGWSDCLLRLGARHIVYEQGRVVLVAATDPEIELWEYEGAVPVRGFLAGAGHEHVSAHRYVARVDDERRLITLRSGWEIVDWHGSDEDGLAHALERARELVPERVVFDHRIHRTGGRLRPADELVDLLVPALEEAVVAAVAASGVPDPFVIRLGLPENRWPPTGHVGGDSFRRRMTGLSPDDGASVSSLYKAEPPAGGRLDLAPHLPPEALKACRELIEAQGLDHPHGSPVRQRADEAQARIARALSQRLNARDWPAAVEPFLVLVGFAEPYDDRDGMKLAAETAGRDRVRAFERSTRSRRGRPSPPPEAARTDREALAAALAEHGLEEHAHRLAHEVARVGFKLEEGAGAGHLGGPPLLPPGEDWPQGLTFLAGIDTSGIESLPDGWMLFFADPEEWIEDGEGARFFFTTEPVEAAGPALRRRRVRAVPQLTLPDGWDAGSELGLDPAEAEAYEPVANWLRHGEEHSFDDPDHWVLGSVTDVQGNPLEEDDEVLLLHLSWDTALGFEYLDGGALRFSIPRDALAAGDWSHVRAEASSG